MPFGKLAHYVFVVLRHYLLVSHLQTRPNPAAASSASAARHGDRQEEAVWLVPGIATKFPTCAKALQGITLCAVAVASHDASSAVAAAVVVAVAAATHDASCAVAVAVAVASHEYMMHHVQ